jgi:hypothetical protein
MVEPKFRYAPVRRTSDSGKEWIDLGDMAINPHEAMNKAEATNKMLAPNWDAVHPVVRIARVKIEEVADG